MLKSHKLRLICSLFAQSCIQWKKNCNLCVQNFIFEGKRAWRFQEDRKLAHSQSKSITWRQEGRLLTLDTRREYWRYPATHTGLDSCAITRSWHYVFSAEFKYDLILLSLKRSLHVWRHTWRRKLQWWWEWLTILSWVLQWIAETPPTCSRGCEGSNSAHTSQVLKADSRL